MLWLIGCVVLVLLVFGKSGLQALQGCTSLIFGLMLLLLAGAMV